jgi:hypothetical protein
MSAEGASLDKIVAATGWLPYTVRVALTGLRKRGYGLCHVLGFYLSIWQGALSPHV